MQYSLWQLALITTHPHYLADQDHLFCLFCNLEGLTGLAGRCFTPLHMAQCEPHGLWRKPGIQAWWELTARQVYSRAAFSKDTKQPCSSSSKHGRVGRGEHQHRTSLCDLLWVSGSFETLVGSPMTDERHRMPACRVSLAERCPLPSSACHAAREHRQQSSICCRSPYRQMQRLPQQLELHQQQPAQQGG